VRDGVGTAGCERIKALARENKELRQANEILRRTSAFFAQAELDRLKKSRFIWPRVTYSCAAGVFSWIHERDGRARDAVRHLDAAPSKQDSRRFYPTHVCTRGAF
jgi:hypothetical protein